LGKYIFFQHLSQSTLPPSIGIHRPSSIILLQLAHCFVLRDLFEEADELLVTLFDGFKMSNSLGLAMVGLVWERVGSLGGLLELSLTGLWFSTPAGKICLVGESGDKLAFVVGDRGVSSNSVSMALSRAPTDFAVVLAPYPECEDEVAERLRIGTREEYAEPDDFDDRGDELGNFIPSCFDTSFSS
jgi:hypothetical protein